MSNLHEKAKGIASQFFPNKTQEANNKDLTDRIVKLVQEETGGNKKPQKKESTEASGAGGKK